MPPIAQPAPARAGGRGLEQLLVENWLVWLGGATLALGGAFLVKVSIDYGLLTPVVRVVMGIALGFGLSVAAEWVRRRDPPLPGDRPPPTCRKRLLRPDRRRYSPPSMRRYALYGLIPSGVAFVLLAATAVGGRRISLRHGPLVAALGLVGAYRRAVAGAERRPARPAAVRVSGRGRRRLDAAAAAPRMVVARLVRAGRRDQLGADLAAAEGPAEAPVIAGYLLVLFGLFAALRRGVGLAGSSPASPILRLSGR